MSGGVWIGARPLMLASASLTRRALLESVDLAPSWEAADIDERAIERSNPTFDPPTLSLALARAKSAAVSLRYPDHLVIGADQVLSIDGRSLHKPLDAEEAVAHLLMLSGRTHHLHAAVALAEGGRVISDFVETASLAMRSLDDDAIRAYVRHAGAERVTSSVGAYQLEGVGAHLFDSVEGDHSTILGLPLFPLLALLRGRGLLAF